MLEEKERWTVVTSEKEESADMIDIDLSVFEKKSHVTQRTSKPNSILLAGAWGSTQEDGPAGEDCAANEVLVTQRVNGGDQRIVLGDLRRLDFGEGNAGTPWFPREVDGRHEHFKKGSGWKRHAAKLHACRRK